MKYRVEADRNVTVDGLAVFTPGEVKYFGDYEIDVFWNMRGLKLNQCNVPEGVTVTIITDDEEKVN